MTTTTEWAELPAGDLRLLGDPIATDLLASTELARLAYVAPDGTPRVIPVGWIWLRGAFVIGTMRASSKITALRRNPAVALSIDRPGPPPVALLVRGRAEVRETDGPPPEYIEMQRKYYGPEQAAQVAVTQANTPMAVVTITPTWVTTMDFQTRFPAAIGTARS
jgi:PPOX class probable F420-dependent enzyme